MHDLLLLVLNFNHMFVMVVIMFYDLHDFLVIYIEGLDCRYVVFSMSKNTAIKLLNNSQLDDKSTL